jgi:DNA-binding transcriptional LysR family regulator
VVDDLADAGRGERLPQRVNVGQSDLHDSSRDQRRQAGDTQAHLRLVLKSRMIGVLPRSLVEPVPAGLVCVPVTDAPPSRLVLAWNDRDRRPLVASFVTAALVLQRRSAGATY